VLLTQKKERDSFMNRDNFAGSMKFLLPESSEKLAAVWIRWAEEMTEYYSGWLAENAKDVPNGEVSDKTLEFYRLRSNVEGNLQEIHASLHNINRQYGGVICGQIYDLAAIPCCVYPLEAINIAEYLHKGGNPNEIEQRTIDGEFEWEFPENLALLTPIASDQQPLQMNLAQSW